MFSVHALFGRFVSRQVVSWAVIVAALAIASSAHAQRDGRKRTGGDEGGLAGAAPPVGRCCYGTEGSCAILTYEQCDALDGVYMGDGTDCAEFDCSQLGRCCINDNFNVSCEYVTISECFGPLNGSYWQPGVTCEEAPCAPFGACCRTIGDVQLCQITAQFICEAVGGAYLGDNLDCAGIECVSLGACCMGSTCEVTTELDCTGTFLGIGTTCADNPCTQIGQCCTTSGCLTTTQAECATQGVWLGEDGDCADCPDMTLGACCLDRSTCEQLTRSECDDFGGTYYGDGSDCFDVVVDCESTPQTGACCIIDSCFHTTQEICDYFNGTFAGVDEECFDISCAQPGACCYDNGTQCQVVTESECDALGGTFVGSGTQCGPGECPGLIGHCCLQNADGSSSCLTSTINQCFATSGAVYWGLPGTCNDPWIQCPPFGACCTSTGCFVTTQQGCVNQGGTYSGDGTTCADSDLNGVAERCEIPGDCDGNGSVDTDDLLLMLGLWGPCPSPCRGDVYPEFVGDGAVNTDDLLLMLGNWTGG